MQAKLPGGGTPTAVPVRRIAEVLDPNLRHRRSFRVVGLPLHHERRRASPLAGSGRVRGQLSPPVETGMLDLSHLEDASVNAENSAEYAPHPSHPYTPPEELGEP